MTSVNVSRVNEDSVEFVVVRLGSVSFRVEVRGEVDFEGELVSVVDLRVSKR